MDHGLLWQCMRTMHQVEQLRIENYWTIPSADSGLTIKVIEMEMLIGTSLKSMYTRKPSLLLYAPFANNFLSGPAHLISYVSTSLCCPCH